jgi:formamidopyrimidine-DNA glycosylase
LSGKKIKAAEVAVPAVVKRSGTKKQFAGRLDGAKFGGTSRKGMWLVSALDTGDLLVVGLGDKGRILRAQNKDAVDKSTVVTISFTQHGQLRILDPTKKSEAFVITPEELPGVVGELGFDLIEEPVSWTAFGERLLRRQGKLKSILMDDTFVVGIGPMYSDEILFESGLRFDRTPQSLSTQEIRRLYRATVEKIHDAVKYNGTSLGEDGFTDIFGKRGSFQDELAVYGRDGEMSPRARDPIVKARFGQGYTYYCGQTQM